MFSCDCICVNVYYVFCRFFLLNKDLPNLIYLTKRGSSSLCHTCRLPDNVQPLYNVYIVGLGAFLLAACDNIVLSNQTNIIV